MAKEKTPASVKDEVKVKNKKEAKVNQNQAKTPESNFSTTQLFILVLILSIAFNCYIQWKKSEKTQNGANDEKLTSLEKELTEKRELIELFKKEQIEIVNMFSIYKIVEIAKSSEPVVRYASNETRAALIIKVAKNVLSKPYYSCQKSIPVEKYDEYKNCFRDLAIELHNQLETKLPDSHLFVAAGRVHYSFMVTTMSSKRSEYFISFGDILFELLEYSELISEPRAEELNTAAEPIAEETFETQANRTLVD